MYIGKTFLQLVFDALRARRELDNFLNQFHYGGATKSVVDPRLGTAIAVLSFLVLSLHAGLAESYEYLRLPVVKMI
jgi:hypothetical protein